MFAAAAAELTQSEAVPLQASASATEDEDATARGARAARAWTPGSGVSPPATVTGVAPWARAEWCGTRR